MTIVRYLTTYTSNLVTEGDRIAQLIIEKIETPQVLEVTVSLPTIILVV